MFTPNQSDKGTIIGRVTEKVTDVMRYTFSPRSQKLVKAGLLTKCSEFTPAFDNVVRVIALEKWGDEVEAKADEIIAAEAESRK